MGTENKYKAILDTFLVGLASLPQKLLSIFDTCITTVNSHISSPKKMIWVLLGAWVTFELVFTGSSKVVAFIVGTSGQILGMAKEANFQTIALLVIVIVGLDKLKK